MRYKEISIPSFSKVKDKIIRKVRHKNKKHGEDRYPNNSKI